MNGLIFGAAYYPEYEIEKRTEKDFEMMKAAGMNTIRIAESTWSTWEKNEGEYDFSILTDTLDSAEKYDMQVIIGTPTYAVPSWLVKKDPDVLATTKQGRGIYGARQIMDIMNPTYRDAAEKIIRRMMEVVKDRKCVIGYQIDNETKHYGTSGANIQKLFKKYLIEKFGTVEELNKRFGFAYWSNSIGKWDDLPDVRGTINGSYAAEFERFQRHLAAEFLIWQRKIIDEYRRDDQFVTHNFDFEWRKDELAPFGHSYGVQPGINHYEASDAVTIAGCDIYHPTQDDLTGVEIAYGGDSIRTLKNSPYIVLETEAQAFRYWTPYPGQLYQQAFSHIASGAMGVEYWHWHSIHNSYETYWKGVLSHDMEENEVYKEAKAIGEDFKKIYPYIKKSSKRNRIALITDNHSQTALELFPIGDAKDEPGDEYISYNDVVRIYYDALYMQNLECDIIDVRSLEKNSRDYDMIITPALYSATDETISYLRTFVENGGVLVSSFKSFFTDENLQVRHEKQPYRMTDVFGAYYQEFTRPGKTKLRGKDITVWQELLFADPSTEAERYEHKYWGKYAAITHNKYKKGHAIYIGCNCDAEIVKDELGKAASLAGVKSPDEKFPIIIRSLATDDGKEIRFIFNYSDGEKKISCNFDNAVDILTNKEYKRNDEICIKDWGLKILYIGKH
ncbi:beta-galactosidase [Lachnospiraceae bacterium C1.1]|nr:beta-galactosidase [Lachnospiraceae bacterium C1.1]